MQVHISLSLLTEVRRPQSSTPLIQSFTENYSQQYTDKILGILPHEGSDNSGGICFDLDEIYRFLWLSKDKLTTFQRSAGLMKRSKECNTVFKNTETLEKQQQRTNSAQIKIYIYIKL